MHAMERKKEFDDESNINKSKVMSAQTYQKISRRLLQDKNSYKKSSSKTNFIGPIEDKNLRIKNMLYPLLPEPLIGDNAVIYGYHNEMIGSLELAYTYYMKSVEFEEDARGLFMLAQFYQYGKIFIQKDLKIANTYYHKAAKHGCVDAQFTVGLYYQLGECNFEKNYNKAFEWYQKAAFRQHPHALAYLGRFYESGIAVPQDFKQAFNFYLQSANLGSNFGNYHLGRTYLDGIGTEINIDLAENYLWQAKKTIPEAHYLLARIYEQKEVHGDAFNLYLEATKFGIPEAYLQVGNYYSEGKAVFKDIFLAKENYKKAAELGNLEAKVKLLNLDNMLSEK